jgi:hypothetical protein
MRIYGKKSLSDQCRSTWFLMRGKHKPLKLTEEGNQPYSPAWLGFISDEKTMRRTRDASMQVRQKQMAKSGERRKRLALCRPRPEDGRPLTRSPETWLEAPSGSACTSGGSQSAPDRGEKLNRRERLGFFAYDGRTGDHDERALFTVKDCVGRSDTSPLKVD